MGCRRPGEERTIDELSVIVPMYNAQDFVANCLATIRTNVEEGMRFYLIDDCSSDETPRIVEAALEQMPYVTFLRNEQNQGVARSRNIVMEHVDSRYVTYLDVDDWYRPGHLGRLLASIKDLQTDMVRTDYVRAQGSGRKHVDAPDERRNVPIKAVDGIGRAGETTMVNYPFLWAGIYDLQKIDRGLFAFDEHLRTAADRPWFWRMHLQTDTYAVVDLDGYLYRKDTNATALTQTGSVTALHFTDAYHRVFDHVHPAGTREQRVKAAYDACRISLWHIQTRERYAPDLQQQLLGRAAGLLARIPDDELAEAIAPAGWHVGQRTLLKRLHRAGKDR